MAEDRPQIKTDNRKLGEEAIKITTLAKEKSDKMYAALLRLTGENNVDNLPDYVRGFHLKGEQSEDQLLDQFDQNFSKISPTFNSQEEKEKALIDLECKKILLQRLGFTDAHGKTTDKIMEELKFQHNPNNSTNIYVIKSPVVRGVSLVREVKKVMYEGTSEPKYFFKEQLFVGNGDLLKRNFFVNAGLYLKKP